jgi:hypothetical protein
MKVHGSGFRGSGFDATWHQQSRNRRQTQNSEPGTLNLELELRTRALNGETGTLNGSPWQ